MNDAKTEMYLAEWYEGEYAKIHIWDGHLQITTEDGTVYVVSQNEARDGLIVTAPNLDLHAIVEGHETVEITTDD